MTSGPERELKCNIVWQNGLWEVYTCGWRVGSLYSKIVPHTVMLEESVSTLIMLIMHAVFPSHYFGAH